MATLPAGDSIRSMARADIARYLIALGILAVMTVASFQIIRHLITEIRGTEAVVMHAAEMRSDLHKTKMAAQDLILHLQEMREAGQVMAHDEHPVDLKMGLKHAVGALDQRLAWLVEAMRTHDPGPEVWAFMREEPYRLEAETRDLVTFARDLDGAHSIDDIDMSSMRALGMAHMAHSDPNNGVDRLIDFLRNKIGETISWASSLHDAIGIATLVVLAIEALIIFRPLVQRLRRESTRAEVAESELAYLASHDALTGLHNRVTFERSLAAIIDRGDRDAGLTAVLLVDLDDFKPINDSLGHAAGDKMLKVVAERLIAGNGDGDLVARLGGDEFVLAWHDLAHPREIDSRCEELLASLRQPVVIGGRQVCSGASVGVALVHRHGSSLTEILAAADHAMYVAKKNGKNAYALFDPITCGRGGEREAAINELRGALNRDELVVHFQPILSHGSGAAIGYEALVRWQHPTRGLLLPGEFLPAVQACGMMIDLTDLVMDRALKQAVNLRKDGQAELFVSVNVPQEFLLLTDLSDRVLAALAKYRLPPDALLVEVVESVTLGGQSLTVEQSLAKLKAIGVRIAFDDFGPGQASLVDLRLLSVDTIKIDRELVNELAGRPEALKLLEGIVAMARVLGKDVIIEGVETAVQHRLLECCGGIWVQGFYYGRPTSLPDAGTPSRDASAAPRLEVVS